MTIFLVGRLRQLSCVRLFNCTSFFSDAEQVYICEVAYGRGSLLENVSLFQIVHISFFSDAERVAARWS